MIKAEGADSQINRQGRWTTDGKDGARLDWTDVWTDRQDRHTRPKAKFHKTRVMAWLIKPLPCKCQDLSSDPQNMCGTLDSALCACNLSRKMRGRDRKVLRNLRPACPGYVQSSRLMRERKGGKSPVDQHQKLSTYMSWPCMVFSVCGHTIPAGPQSPVSPVDSSTTIGESLLSQPLCLSSHSYHSPLNSRGQSRKIRPSWYK